MNTYFGINLLNFDSFRSKNR